MSSYKWYSVSLDDCSESDYRLKLTKGFSEVVTVTVDIRSDRIAVWVAGLQISRFRRIEWCKELTCG